MWLIVPFEVATGTSDAACELPGHGWVTAAHAREVMTRPGSVWRTTVDNLHLKHRWHHDTKTDGVWTSRPVVDGGLEWTTLTGRTYVTHPKDWREGVGPPYREATPDPAPNDEAPPPF